MATGRPFLVPNLLGVASHLLFTAVDAGEGGSRLMQGGNRDRLVDCVEEFVKYTIVMRPHFNLFSDRSLLLRDFHGRRHLGRRELPQ